MADEVPAEVEAKSKKPILLIIVGVVVLLVLIAATVVGTLFLSGAFNPKPPTPEEMAAAAEGHDAAKEDCLPKKKEKGGDAHGEKADAHAKPDPHAKPAEHGAKDEKAKADCPKGPPGKVAKNSPELTRFEYTYMQIEREFLVNVSGSKKVMSVQLAIMTHYDDRVFENVKKHDFAMRSAIMDTMRMTTDADLVKPEFRKELAQKIRDTMNTLLEKYEDFGGIEDVYFTNFIVQ